MRNHQCNTDRGVTVGSGFSARIPGSDVLDDEQLLARLDEAELAAGEVFDGGRILTQAPRLLAEPGIFGAHLRQRLFEAGVLLPGLHYRQQSLLADERVNHQDTPDEQKEVLHGAAAAPAGESRARLGGGGRLLQSQCRGPLRGSQ